MSEGIVQPDTTGTAASLYTLAVDAMGGDRAPDVVIDGLAIAIERHPGVRFLVVGDEARLAPLMARKRLGACCTVRHAPEVIGGEMKPTAALRLRNSSMRVAIDAVATGEASGVISAGNTGALLALAKIVIKTLPGVDRPALAALAPSARGDVVMLDLGANTLCDSRNLVEYAVMGDVFARAVLGLPAPTIGLLNIGSEELKGDERVQKAAEILRASHLAPQFHGFVEGDDIPGGTTDVVVTDGFTGNVALKMGEGALKLIFGLLKQVFSSSLAGRHRLRAGAARAGAAARMGRSPPLQRCHHAGAERRGGEVPWRDGRRAIRLRHGRRHRHGRAPLQRPHPRRAGADRQPADGCQPLARGRALTWRCARS